MKLYSRRDMTIGIAAGTLVALALIGGISFLMARSGVLGMSQAKSSLQSLSQSSIDSPPRLAAEAKSETGSPTSSVAPEYNAQTGQGYTQDERENINVYEKYNDSVVNITTEVVNVNWFLEPVPQSGGSGSGSIIDSRGYILTNYHVVKGAYKLFANLPMGASTRPPSSGSMLRTILRS